MTATGSAAVVFYARYLYLNPGLPRLLAHYAAGGVPGVRAVDVTQASIAEITQAASAASVILIDQSIANGLKTAAINRNPSYHICDVRPVAFYQEVFERLLEAPVARAFYSYTDLHEPKDDDVLDQLVGKVDAFFWFFEKRPLALDQVPVAYRDKAMELHPDPLIRWHAIRARFPVRVEAWFAVDRSEMTGGSPGFRWQASVPGANYLTRQIAVRSIRAEGLSLAPVRGVRKMAAASTRLATVLPATERRSRYLIGFQNRMQQYFVARSAATFVCGSGVSYPVRKFLEVPAAGSALIAYPCVGFEDYGFADGVNSVTCMPEDAGAKMKAFAAQTGIRERLTRAARDLVDRHHTVERRAADLAQCLFQLQRGSLAGAEFVNGRFEIR